ncbi:LacI family DNA-binding transcriptional regulator [Vagococcus penaei]|uniref:LacI family DNA-binding transcriptional regulator n=1 Tax=Vagococcus penaei TaxID=633807 RepID=UPI001E3B0626|nr:LacI family DNA-binding transcriptional regulator [Vagococcus penaei]
MADMNDVARLAGVSRGTVSNYINGVKVKESTRVKVEAAIKELDYVPNMAGRFLKTQKSDIVVFILPTIWNPFFSELAFYLEKNYVIIS